MCGISAIINNKCSILLLESLKQLQNRGYDSTGRTIQKNKFIINKYASDNINTGINKLENDILNHNDAYIGIGHMDATHGGKTDINSHPHMSYDNKFMIHNGIIENYLELKKIMISNNITFKIRNRYRNNL